MTRLLSASIFQCVAMGTLTDGELARRIAAPGQARAEEGELYARFARRVQLYGLRHLGDETLAADLVQDVMALVIARLRQGKVREPERIGSFVLGTARTMSHDVRRGQRRRAERERQAAAEAVTQVGPVEPLPAERMAACLAELSERERSVVVMSMCAGHSAPEIGEALGMSAGNVRVVRHRALSRLRACMGLEEGQVRS
jgi:RNA polymerase sigma-70 factor (ECF subfamily)